MAVLAHYRSIPWNVARHWPIPWMLHAGQGPRFGYLALYL